MTKTSYPEKIFSYGTLCYESVQLSTFGRKLIGVADTLRQYKLSDLKITNPNVIALSGEDVHHVLVHTGNPNDEISGVVFDINQDELLLADSYEVADYKRVSVNLASGVTAWVYVSKDQTC